MKTVPCPQCQTPVDLSIKTSHRPFCSERCRLIDLGAWAAEEYQIPSQSSTEESGETDVNTDERADWDLPGNIH